MEADRVNLPVGWYVEPTVFADVDNRMRIAQEEIFGPVLAVIPYDDDDDAVAIANDTVFGLAARSGPATSAVDLQSHAGCAAGANRDQRRPALLVGTVWRFQAQRFGSRSGTGGFAELPRAQVDPAAGLKGGR